jgi:predicted helicase
MSKAKIYYRDIGDYLNRNEKLAIVKNFGSILRVPLTELHPNEHGDWLNQRNDVFSSFIPLAPEKKFEVKTQSFFNAYAIGIATNRDAWVYNFSKQKVAKNMQRMIDFFNEQSQSFAVAKQKNLGLEVEDFIDINPIKISWTRALRRDCSNTIQHSFKSNDLFFGLYRPFTKEWLYYDKAFIESPGLWQQIFPTKNHANLVIAISGIGQQKEFSALISNCLSDLQVVDKAQYFPLYYYEENKQQQANLFDTANESKYIRRDAISNFILERAVKQYGKNVSKEDIFYYMYGFLHCPQYREAFASDLKKMLPRLPLVDDVRHFWSFSKAGRKLAELHLNYECAGKHPAVIEIYNPLNITDSLKQANVEEMEYLNYRVGKMCFGRQGKDVDKSVIIYNHQITLENIPAEAYEYIVNGKSAIEWIMERYQTTTHKDSGITNNPNDWAKENNQPRYILDLLLSVINLSVQTMEIVRGLPEVEFDEIS